MTFMWAWGLFSIILMRVLTRFPTSWVFDLKALGWHNIMYLATLLCAYNVQFYTVEHQIVLLECCFELILICYTRRPLSSLDPKSSHSISYVDRFRRFHLSPVLYQN